MIMKEIIIKELAQRHPEIDVAIIANIISDGILIGLQMAALCGAEE